MPTALKRPQLPEGPLDRLFSELHALHGLAGWPSTRELAAKSTPRVSHTTVHALFTSGRLPSMPLLLNIVEQLIERAPRLNMSSSEISDLFVETWQAAADAGSNSAPIYNRSATEGPKFTRSSFCVGTQCVEVGIVDGSGIAIRDSKDPSSPSIIFTHSEWMAFLRGVKVGEFD
ncbi:DUF397 domain-containing protein [Actinomycetospora rhizophila]|uniref:DUF397 domain-containing protein n=1 Tax=Actinomycetospora rhizophila TaxID=1416876 RepID=A0ABV9ZCL8_9PSEU